MANCITRHIPNIITCCNLFSGCIAGIMAYEMRYEWAFCFIFIAALFDFFDGMAARLLHAYSPIGKELDSLADEVSFGLAPSLIVFSLFKELSYPEAFAGWSTWLPYTAFLIAVFSALRLAKFNIDERQTTSFIGMPTPANAIFWASLATGYHTWLTDSHFNVFWLFILVCVMSLLLVAELPMFSLKFKNLTWGNNKVRYIFLLVCILLLLSLGIRSFSLIILWYILLSIATLKKR